MSTAAPPMGGELDDFWMGTRQACQYLDVKKDWLYDRVARDEIPYVKVERLLRFKKSELDQWMEGHRK